MSASSQLRLIILGVVAGACVGVVAVPPRDAFSVALVIFIGVGLLAAALRLAPQIHSLHPAVGRIAITLAGVTIVGLAPNVLSQSEARLTPGHPVEREAMMAPAPAGASQIAGQTTAPATPPAGRAAPSPIARDGGASGAVRDAAAHDACNARRGDVRQIAAASALGSRDTGTDTRRGAKCRTHDATHRGTDARSGTSADGSPDVDAGPNVDRPVAAAAAPPDAARPALTSSRRPSAADR